MLVRIDYLTCYWFAVYWGAIYIPFHATVSLTWLTRKDIYKETVVYTKYD